MEISIRSLMATLDPVHHAVDCDCGYCDGQQGPAHETTGHHATCDCAACHLERYGSPPEGHALVAAYENDDFEPILDSQGNVTNAWADELAAIRALDLCDPFEPAPGFIEEP